MQPLSPTAQTLYAQLLDDALAAEVSLLAGPSKGAALRKLVKGTPYLCWQFRDYAGRVRQVYLGPEAGEGKRLADQLTAQTEVNKDVIEALKRGAATYQVAGGTANMAAHFPVIEALVKAGVFHHGAILVGSHAFTCLGNMLGVSWEGASAMTTDIDFALDDAVAIAVSPGLELSVPATLRDLGMQFFEVAQLDPRTPSTSMQTNKAQVRVDFLTAERRAGNQQPIPFPQIGFAAQPLRFMRYLLTSPPQRALFIGRYAVPVCVPEPAHFAVHKVAVSQERPAAMAAKSEKDLRQAAEVVLALDYVRPGALDIALRAMQNTTGMAKRFTAGVAAMTKLADRHRGCGQAAALLQEAHLALRPT